MHTSYEVQNPKEAYTSVQPCKPEDAGDVESTKGPPEVTSDGDDQDGDGGDNTC